MSWRDGLDFTDLPPEVLAELRCHVSDVDFECAICSQYIDCRWNARGASRQIHPICNICERVSGYRWNGSPHYRPRPNAGAFMDRRNATRILALADTLQAEASANRWRKRHVA